MPNADAAETRPVATSRSGTAWSLIRWLVFSLLLAIVAVIACLPAIVGTPERVTKLIATAIPELAADVKPASVRLGWFGPIVLEDLAIVPRNGDRTPLEVHRVEVEHGLAGILLSAGNLGRVRIEGSAPTSSLTRNIAPISTRSCRHASRARRRGARDRAGLPSRCSSTSKTPWCGSAAPGPAIRG